MSEFSRALSVTASGLKAQASRLRHVSENISNADTPGYRRKTVPFEAVRELQTDVEHVRTGKVTLDRRDLEEVYDPSHPLADESGHYEGSNVDLMIEIADAREAQRSYEANLKMFEQTRSMSASLMDLLRR
ncbi:MULTISPECIES: flagellar basal body rod protein FlgC [unclassified Leisingera]|uniref:flagellar basal body rod protein FlgC n=1 Tax=unclassified Leisingera TaxID=2614906 RepID=UPI00031E7549|nr:MULTISPECIES: flagellar basal body rod protein FlgC [unclassified Leisingera]KIC18316.1 flagellar basal body rod protein FlgC [Leisingera sp. ANG-DT]KIC24259.1 flagellar basal body rod protein FlgC [Leisingera sp. ANG-S3]KIC27949.1 flagellar basal body rod protein FlgC [Leisingera sp. ANG-M6]KIC32984.1 flagellar basal body rod protein FlgC [Leisingera sp. ANG-S5]KIC52975.1 flagellar basal body rod protein FlgC [Leisingera sp. ANG-S]